MNFITPSFLFFINFILIYTTPLHAQNCLARVEKTIGWYIINEKGEKVIEKKYGHLLAFSDGLAGFRDRGKWGYIDSKGNIVIHSNYEGINGFSCGIAKVQLSEGEYSYIDKKGQRITSLEFSSALSCTDSLFFAKKSGDFEFRLYNSKGQEINSANVYKEVYPFKGGIAVVKIKNNRWQFINKKGDVLHEGNYDFLKEFSFGMALFRSSGKWGYIDSTYKIVIPAKYAHAWPFQNEYAKVEDNIGSSDSYIINKKDKIISMGFKETRIYSDGLIAVKGIDNNWGYIDTTGKQLISCNYLIVKDFKEGIALAKSENKKWGYINKKGEWVIKPILAGGKDCKNGFVLVKYFEGTWGFMTAEGIAIGENYANACSFEKVFDNEENIDVEE